MRARSLIIPPTGDDDYKGAKRVFEEFFEEYHDTLVSLEHHLDKITDETEAAYANAYKPWRNAVHELLRGVYLTVKNIPLPDTDAFLDALRMFSFEGAVHFLKDLCISCKMVLEMDWAEKFKKQIDTLLFAFSILNRTAQLQTAPAR